LSLDDLLGLLFLLVFVVGPILRGLLRGSGEAPLLEIELEEPPVESEVRPPAAMPEPERAKTEVQPVPVMPRAEPEPTPPSPPPERRSERAARKLRLDLHRGGILEGIVWHEILSEPRVRRRWKPKR